jgi:hypothetical protein
VDGKGAHLEHAEVQEATCGAMWNLALDETHRAMIVEQGGIKAIADGMRRHTSHAGVQEESCWVLLNIEQGAAEYRTRVRQELADMGVVELVKAAIASPSATERTKMSGQELMDRLEGRGRPQKRRAL